MAKLISWGKDREEAIARLKRVLAEYQISGVVTNIPLFYKIVNHDKFTGCSYDINTLIKDIVNSNSKNNIRNFEEIAALIATLIKNKSSNLTAEKINVFYSNKWLNDNE
jgi:acetyl/propionyl-CoA carboxylase alpha subunit